MAKRNRINKRTVDLLMAHGYQDFDSFAEQWAREEALRCELERRMRGRSIFDRIKDVFRRGK